MEIITLLEKLELQYDQTDIEKLYASINYLNGKKLSDLSQRLLRSTKPHKFLETLTEINFIVQLLKSFSSSTALEVLYEPKETKRPIDVVIKFDNINYYIQIKSLSNSIRENQQSQVIKEIRRQIKPIPCIRGISIHISNNLKKEHVNEMIDFIKMNLAAHDNKKIIYNGSDNEIAEIEFYTVEKPFRNHLFLHTFGDLEAVDITDMTKDQIKGALNNAAGAFEKNSSNEDINLIVSEIKRAKFQSIDFADALYGTTFLMFQNGKMTNHRNNDGLFLQEDFSKKIAGVIVIHKKEAALTSQYEKVICINPLYNYTQPIINLIHDKIIDRFSWIDNSFFE